MKIERDKHLKTVRSRWSRHSESINEDRGDGCTVNPYRDGFQDALDYCIKDVDHIICAAEQEFQRRMLREDAAARQRDHQGG